ncbi:MAG: formylglycine-generating enzyme family protein [Victivallales bacterium]|nr:formylglycine-generating enzyme family protein [Victivallales bacterium]
MSDIAKTASHPFAKQSTLFRHAYCKGIMLSILANTVLPKAIRLEQCETTLAKIRSTLGIQLQESNESYIQNIATTEIEQVLNILRHELTNNVSLAAFLYEITFYQQASFRNDAAFQKVWQSFVDELNFPKDSAPALWNACQTLANCQFPSLDIPLLSWLCGICGISWADVAAIFLGKSNLKENMTIMLPDNVPLELAWCPAGVFMMGSPEKEAERDGDEPQHQVKISKGFWMGIYPVTQKQFKAVMGRNPSNYDSFENHPVENVTWFDAKEFCMKATDQSTKLPDGYAFDLPTEAQWEYACRAGSTSIFHFGAILDGSQANCDGTRPFGTTQEGPNIDCTCDVGSYAPNAWGLYDMHGNVWEWCNDWYGPYQEGFTVDPQGAETGTQRSERGGSWRNAAKRCRTAIRRKSAPEDVYDNLGFRVILTSTKN